MITEREFVFMEIMNQRRIFYHLLVTSASLLGSAWQQIPFLLYRNDKFKYDFILKCIGKGRRYISHVSQAQKSRRGLYLTLFTEPLQASFAVRKRRYGNYQMTHDSQLPFIELNT